MHEVYINHNTYWYTYRSYTVHTCTTLWFMTIVCSPNSSTTVSNTSPLDDSPPNTTTTTTEELMVMAVMACPHLMIMLASSTVTCANVFIVFTNCNHDTVSSVSTQYLTTLYCQPRPSKLLTTTYPREYRYERMCLSQVFTAERKGHTALCWYELGWTMNWWSWWIQ